MVTLKMRTRAKRGANVRARVKEEAQGQLTEDQEQMLAIKRGPHLRKGVQAAHA